MDKMNGSSLGKQCQNPLPPPCPLPPPHLISTAYRDILWSSYLLVLNYMQATSAQAGQLSVKFFEIVHSIHCTTQNTRYWNLNNSMNVVSETDRKQSAEFSQSLPFNQCFSYQSMYMAPSDLPCKMDWEGEQNHEEQCHRDLSAWG